VAHNLIVKAFALYAEPRIFSLMKLTLRATKREASDIFSFIFVPERPLRWKAGQYGNILRRLSAPYLGRGETIKFHTEKVSPARQCEGGDGAMHM
jgi:hypothetical protein